MKRERETKETLFEMSRVDAVRVAIDNNASAWTLGVTLGARLACCRLHEAEYWHSICTKRVICIAAPGCHIEPTSSCFVNHALALVPQRAIEDTTALVERRKSPQRGARREVGSVC